MILNYTSTQYLNCGPCGGEVIMCLNSNLTVNAAPFIEGRLISTNYSFNSRNEKVYSYNINYDENQLLSPNVRLTTCDIHGMFCRGCLTDYIDFVVQQGTTQTPLTGIDTDSIDLTLTGINNTTIQADMNVSAQPGNLISILPDGVFAGGFVRNAPCPSTYYVGTPP